MIQSRNLLLAAVLATGFAAAPAFSQGAPQSVVTAKVDLQSLATGYRTSKVVGAAVYNEANEKVGVIDDLIVTPSERVPYAVLSVGGFLGDGHQIRGRSLQLLAGRRKENEAAGRNQSFPQGPSGIQIRFLIRLRHLLHPSVR